MSQVVYLNLVGSFGYWQIQDFYSINSISRLLELKRFDFIELKSIYKGSILSPPLFFNGLLTPCSSSSNSNFSIDYGVYAVIDKQIFCYITAWLGDKLAVCSIQINQI